jgi:hypothetical protein
MDWTRAWRGDERRAHRRVPVGRPVAMLVGRDWQPCEIADVSRGGAAFHCQHRPPVDKEVVVRVDGLGLFICRVLRHTALGFAARFEAADFSADAPDILEAPEPAPPPERRALAE